jgi:hypothetical protein
MLGGHSPPYKDSRAICRRWESNPHALSGALDFESSVSAIPPLRLIAIIILTYSLPSIVTAAATVATVAPNDRQPRPLPQELMMDPRDILFTMPTLENAVPTALSPCTPAQECYQMHEDDWRQFEFVHASFASEMADELAAIDRI